jgi:hypothetical protein
MASTSAWESSTASNARIPTGTYGSNAKPVPRKYLSHQQDACWCAATRVTALGLEDGRLHGRRHVRVQAIRRGYQGRPGFQRNGGVRRTTPRHTLSFAAGLSWNDGSPIRNGVFSETQATVGRPLMPMSCPEDDAPRGCRWCCGRRGGAYYGSSCAQVVDAYAGSRRVADGGGAPSRVRPLAAVQFALELCSMQPIGLSG